MAYVNFMGNLSLTGGQVQVPPDSSNFVEIVHSTNENHDFDAEARTWNDQKHLRNHRVILQDCMKIRPKIANMNGLGEALFGYWVRQTKPGRLVRVFCKDCACVYDLPDLWDDDEEYCHTCPGVILQPPPVNFVPPVSVGPAESPTTGSNSLEDILEETQTELKFRRSFFYFADLFLFFPF